VSSEVVIREAETSDDVAELVAAAFADEGEQVARIWSEIESSDALRASLVAEVDGSLAGHVGLSHAWLDARRALVDVWLLSPLSVAPARQGEQIGTRLLAAAVTRAKSADAPLLFVEGSPDYYGARGFERARDHGFLPATVRTPDAAFRVVRLPGHQDWMSGQVIYRDVWWRHDSAGLRDPLLAQLEGAQ
jgi:putative acetyltransferase